MQYVDTSALLKRYVEEADSARSEAFLQADLDWVSARHTSVEVRRNLARLLPDPAARAIAMSAFAEDWARMYVVELDEATCESAATIAETTSARTLDALHLAAAMRVGGRQSTFLTFDLRQAQAARVLDLRVLGS
jgi:predicted nucleic acid-binding protein